MLFGSSCDRRWAVDLLVLRENARLLEMLERVYLNLRLVEPVKTMFEQR